YVRWAMRHPARFKLTFGSWSKGSDELADSATAARSALVAAVERAQASKALPKGDPDRVAALILATAHGAVDLALSGHLSPTGNCEVRVEGVADVEVDEVDVIRRARARRRDQLALGAHRTRGPLVGPRSGLGEHAESRRHQRRRNLRADERDQEDRPSRPER